ncbi:hypothetical protein Clacol_009414 [Clathrus columnatus]|uniref:Uncharacterized protein n=1 Tax=Clathrus columnatus TaxID=1419009 RepID=A0AAV5APP8_9AGAM|nr:hypothetical protein Clacol_009414 [Clathrus columnatus]
MAIGNTSQIALSPTYSTLRSLLLALDITSTVFLSILLITVTLSQRVSRHPVFLNFITTLLMFSAVRAYSGLAELSFFANKNVIKVMFNPDAAGQNYGIELADLTFDLFQTPLQDMVWMTAQIATLNLLIHTWFTIRSMLKVETKEMLKRRTAILVMTSYIAGLLPIIELLPSAAQTAQTVISLSQVLVHLATAIWALFLIFSYMRQQRALKKVKMQTSSSVTTLTKLVIFSLYGVILTILLLAAGASGSKTLISISLLSQSFFSLFAFLLFGFDPMEMESTYPETANRESFHTDDIIA